MDAASDPEVVSVPAASTNDDQTLMRLRYGLNVGDRWRGLTAGSRREMLLSRLREAGAAQVRVFLDAIDWRRQSEWAESVSLLEAISGAGATPMIAIAQPAEWRGPHAVLEFAGNCAELVDRSCEHWGQETVASWYWSIGDEPNSPWTNNGLTFEGYRDIYETVATLIRQKTDVAGGQRPRIGGPSIDGFQPFWFDWLWRFIEEVDDSLIGFVSWNRYGEWRDLGTWAAPGDPEIFQKLLLSRTAEYWSRSVALGSALEGRGILNICSELNAYAHGDSKVAAPFNQGMFGAVYYTSALIELMRGGADGEFLWALECADDPYAALDERGRATLTYEAKRLVANHIHFGDRIIFPLDADPDPDLDAVIGCKDTGGRAAVLVHRSSSSRSIDLQRWPDLVGFSKMTWLEADSADDASSPFESVLDVEGYAVVLLS